VKKATKPKTKVQEVPNVERMYSFKHSPVPDLPGLDFDVNQFLLPMLNIPYSFEYPSILTSVHYGFSSDTLRYTPETNAEVVIPDEVALDFPRVDGVSFSFFFFFFFFFLFLANLVVEICDTEFHITFDDPSLTEDLFII